METRGAERTEHQMGSSAEPEQSNRTSGQGRPNDRKRLGISRTWDKIAEILVHAAKEVCGTHGETVGNPCIIGAETELELMREEIN